MIRLRSSSFAGHARLIGMLGVMLLLAGCAGGIGSVAGSCAVFERPPYAVRGKTPYDQNVADGFVESGVAGCNWKRPAPRPASLDAVPGRAVAAPAPPKRRGLIRRLRERVLLPHPKPPEVAVAPPVAPAPVAPVTAPPAPPPRRPIDELLTPSR